MMTYEEVLAKLMAMTYRQRASINGARVYYRAGHSFQGRSGWCRGAKRAGIIPVVRTFLPT
jgi:hypothetical protein